MADSTYYTDVQGSVAVVANSTGISGSAQALQNGTGSLNTEAEIQRDEDDAGAALTAKANVFVDAAGHFGGSGGTRQSYVRLRARRQSSTSSADCYMALFTIDGTADAAITLYRVVSSVATAIASATVPGLAAGDMWLRLSVIGTGAAVRVTALYSDGATDPGATAADWGNWTIAADVADTNAARIVDAGLESASLAYNHASGNGPIPNARARELVAA